VVDRTLRQDFGGRVCDRGGSRRPQVDLVIVAGTSLQVAPFPICMPYMYAFYVSLMCMPYMYNVAPGGPLLCLPQSRPTGLCAGAGKQATTPLFGQRLDASPAR